MWDLWWTKWHWDRFFSKFFNFLLPISFHQGSILIYIILGINNRLTGGHSSEIVSPPLTRTKTTIPVISLLTSIQHRKHPVGHKTKADFTN
jgi:hypothetical protein